MITVSPELQAISDRACLCAYGIGGAYKHLHTTLVERDYPANRLQTIRHLADDKYTAHVSINNAAPITLSASRRSFHFNFSCGIFLRYDI